MSSNFHSLTVVNSCHNSHLKEKVKEKNISCYKILLNIYRRLLKNVIILSILASFLIEIMNLRFRQRNSDQMAAVYDNCSIHGRFIVLNLACDV